MGYSVWVLQVATVLIGVMLAPTRSGATIDATGRWVIRGDGFLSPIVLVENWVQVGSSLTTDDSYAGTINPDNGAFNLSRPPGPLCGQDTRWGTVAQDGRTLTASENMHTLGTPSMCFFGFVVSESGTRCPDGIVEPGEQCDDGNADPGDGCD